MDRLGDSVRAPACRAGDAGSNPGPGENFSLKLIVGLSTAFTISRRNVTLYYQVRE